MSAPSSTQSRPTLAFIGGGQMASAMIAGLLRAGQHGSSILVIEPTPDRRDHLEQTFEVRTAARADAQLAAAELVVWAVKPQVLRQAIQEARMHLGTALHVSIAAGLPLETLSQWLQSQRVVRALPNTAALVGAGVTGMVAAEGVSEADRQLAAAVLAATGHCFWVESDERLDAVTAVSGSGPAYCSTSWKRSRQPPRRSASTRRPHVSWCSGRRQGPSSRPGSVSPSVTCDPA